MATQSSAPACPARYRRVLADLLNAVDARDDRALLDTVEALTARLGVAGWPLDVTAQRIAQWGLSQREVVGLIHALRALGVTETESRDG